MFCNTAVVFFANGIGDFLVALPAMRALRRQAQRLVYIGANSQVDYLCRREVEPDEMYSIEVRDDGAGGKKVIYDDQYLKGNQGCVFFSLCTWFDESIIELAEKCSATTSIGLFDGFDKHPEKREAHYCDQLFSLVELGCGDVGPIGCWAFPLDTEQEWNILRSHIEPVARYRILSVHLETLSQKSVELRAVRPLVEKLWELGGYDLGFVISERPVASEIPFPNCMAFGGASLALAFAVTSKSHVFIGADSCLLHVADLCRIPSVALFRNSDPKEFGPRFSPNLTLVDESGQFPAGGQLLDDWLTAIGELKGEPRSAIRN